MLGDQRARFVTFDVPLGQAGFARRLHRHNPVCEQLHQPIDDRLHQGLHLLVCGRLRFDELGRNAGTEPGGWKRAAAQRPAKVFGAASDGGHGSLRTDTAGMACSAAQRPAWAALAVGIAVIQRSPAAVWRGSTTAPGAVARTCSRRCCAATALLSSPSSTRAGAWPAAAVRPPRP